MLMDYYEKGLYNHILASQNHADGMMCYFVPLSMGGKNITAPLLMILPAVLVRAWKTMLKYNESIYFKGADGSLYVNLFIPSVLNWHQKALSLNRKAAFPNDDHISFTINTKKPVIIGYPHP
jgi:DUF1680 family protein